MVFGKYLLPVLDQRTLPSIKAEAVLLHFIDSAQNAEKTPKEDLVSKITQFNL